MLVLTRRLNQVIYIGSHTEISIKVLRIDGKQVRIGICAPDGTKIIREELIATSGENILKQPKPRSY